MTAVRNALPLNSSESTTFEHQEECNLSTRDHRYQEFWEGLSEFMADRNGPVAPPIVSDMNYVKFPPILRGFNLCAAFDTRRPNRKVELLITGPRRDDYAQLLMSQRAEIESEVGSGLDWNISLKGEKKVSLWDRGSHVFAGPRSDHYAWYAEMLELLFSVFAPRIRRVTVS